MMATRRQLRQIFLWPLVIAVLSGFGLLSALVGDGVWDWASWLALGVPLALAFWFLRPRREEH